MVSQKDIAPGAKGSDKAVITRPDGSSTIIDRNTGRVVGETNKEGKEVIRLFAQTATVEERAQGKGGTTFSSPRDQRTNSDLRDFQNQEQENARVEQQANFRSTSGNLVRVDYNIGNNDSSLMTPNANFRTTSGDLARVDVTVNTSPISQPSRLDNLRSRVNTFKDSRFGEFLLGNNLTSSDGKQIQGGSPFQLISPAGAIGLGAKGAQLASRAKKTDKLIKQGAIAIGGSVAISEASKNLGTITSNKEFLKNAGISNIRETEKQLFVAGRSAELESLSGLKGIFNKESNNDLKTKVGITGKKILAEVSIFGGGQQGKQAFASGVREEALRLGIDPGKAESFALRQRQFRGFGEIGSFSFLSAGTEIIGTSAVAGTRLFSNQATTFSTKKGAQQLFRTTGLQIAKAGAIEGAGFNIVQVSSRSETFKPKSFALETGLGAVTAGVLGGTIIAQQVKRPALSKALYAGAVITDPFEIVGDVTANQLIKRGVVKTTVPTISISPTKEEVTIGRTKTSTSNINTPKSPLNTNTNVFTFNRGFSFVPTTSFSSTPNTINTFTLNKGINIFNVQNTITQPNSNTNALVTTTTPTSTTIPVNVTSYKPQLPPPLIPFGIPSGASGKSSTKKKSVFVDELSLGINFLRKNAKRGDFF
jgi:hypothetical protein